MGRNNADFQLSRLAIPDEPGTAPIPEGHARLFHYTRPEHLASIRSSGLMPQEDGPSARQGEPAMVWASEKVPDSGKAFVEFHVPREEWESNGAFSRNALPGGVPARNIVAIHEPWHVHARALLGAHTATEIANGALEQYRGYNDPEVNKAIEALTNG